MRVCISGICLVLVLMLTFATEPAGAAEIPTCSIQGMKRNGNEITIGLQQLRNVFNQKLSAGGSNYSDLQLTGEGHNKLRVSAKQNGKTISISGSLHVASNGAIKLHANKIVRDGTNEKGMMDLFGQDLANYAHFSKTPSLSAKGNDLLIHIDPLMNVSGKLTRLSLDQSQLKLKFESQPCR